MPQCANTRTYGQNQPEAREADRLRYERVEAKMIEQAKLKENN